MNHTIDIPDPFSSGPETNLKNRQKNKKTNDKA